MQCDEVILGNYSMLIYTFLHAHSVFSRHRDFANNDMRNLVKTAKPRMLVYLQKRDNV